MALSCYVAGRLTRREEVEGIIRTLEEAGVTITLDWTKKGYELHTQEDTEQFRQERYTDPGAGIKNEAEESLQAILDAEVFVILTDPEGSSMYVLLGAAIAARRLQSKPQHIYAIGPSGRMLMYQLDEITKVSNIKEVLQDLRGKGLI